MAQRDGALPGSSVLAVARQYAYPRRPGRALGYNSRMSHEGHRLDLGRGGSVSARADA